MSKRRPKVSYWREAPMPRDQFVLFATTLEDCIPDDHSVRLLDVILNRLCCTGLRRSRRGTLCLSILAAASFVAEYEPVERLPLSQIEDETP